jgi:NADH-quinone oxidoreductase subunit F
VEGVAIASYAIRASFAVIYVRGEIVHVIRRLQQAVIDAYAAGHLGKDIGGSGFDLDVVVHAGSGRLHLRRGDGAARLARGLPRPAALRPPFPATHGLYASPTVVNNVESIASVPSIVLGGAEWFSSMGTEKSKGYTLYSLSGHVKNPGQFEAPLGITLRQLLELSGGMREGHELKFWTPGRVVDAAAHRRAPRRPARLRGRRRRRLDARHQGAAVLRRHHLRRARDRPWTEFYAHESCGKCTPAARAPTGWSRSCSASRPAPAPRRTSPRCWTPATTSSAVVLRAGDGATSPIVSGVQYFRDEFIAHVTGRGCPFDPHASTVFATAGTSA